MMRIFEPRFKNGNFFSDTYFYLKNYPQMSNHPPLADILARLTIVARKIDIYRLRYLSLFYFLLSLPILYFFYRELKLSKETSYWALAIFSSLSLISLVSSFPKAYALWILSSSLALLLYLKRLENPNLFFRITSLLSFHCAIQVHYFSVLILPLYYLALAIYTKKKNLLHIVFLPLVYFLTSFVYYPIIKIQKSFTSAYFDHSLSFLSELKLFFRSLVNFYGLNFKFALACILIIFLLYCFYKSENKKQKLFYLILSTLPSLAVLIYDLIAGSHMLEALRYSLLGLIFVPIFLAITCQTRIILFICLITNMLFPALAEKKYLNSNNLSFVKETLVPIAELSKKNTVLVLVDSYQIKNLLLLYELKNLNCKNDNIFVANPESNFINFTKNHKITTAYHVTLNFHKKHLELSSSEIKL